VVQRARDLPTEQCPRVADREQDTPQVGWLSNILVAVLGDFCVRNRLAPNLVTNNSDLKLLVRSCIQGGGESSTLSAGVPLTQGWRSQFVLPLLQDVLAGRRRVRISEPGSDAPLAYDP
jgi:ribonuclease D